MGKVVKKEENSVVAASAPAPAIQVDPTDVQIPKLLIGQNMSEAVTDGLVGIGEIYLSTSKTVLGGWKKGSDRIGYIPVEFIPLSMYKTWVISKLVKGKFEFERIDQFKLGQSSLPWEFEEDGVQMKREMSLNFYGLLPNQLEADAKVRKKIMETGEMPEETPDPVVPVLIQFKSTSYKNGKVLASYFAQVADFMSIPGSKVKPYNVMFNLSSEKVKNDKGTFFVWNAARGSATSKDYRDVCEFWLNVVKGQNLNVDNSDLNAKKEVSTEGQF